MFNFRELTIHSDSETIHLNMIQIMVILYNTLHMYNSFLLIISTEYSMRKITLSFVSASLIKAKIELLIHRSLFHITLKINSAFRYIFCITTTPFSTR